MHLPEAGPGPARNAPPHVLVVDDDVDIGLLLSRYFRDQGMRVSIAESGAQLRQALGGPPFDVVLLDLGLPDEDGLALIRDLRSRWACPVIIVSGRGESVERVVGLELGADDYVTKPFDLRELLARVRSVLRRAQPPPTNGARGYEFAGMRLDLHGHALTGPDGAEIPLTSGEFQLLRVLAERPHHVVTRDQLMNALHGRDAGPYDRAIDVQIGRLRRKLEADPANPRLIRSVRGAGYLFAPDVTAF